MIEAYAYIQAVSMTGVPDADAIRLYDANGRQKTKAHCEAVADVCADIARRVHLEERKLVTAALMHDIAAVVKPVDMLKYAHTHHLKLDASERVHPFILHQRVSAVIAVEDFNVADAQIVSAIECHSTLKANAGGMDMALFLADKIAWDRGGTPPYAGALSDALDVSLERACLFYIKYALAHDLILMPHQWLLQAVKWLETKERNA